MSHATQLHTRGSLADSMQILHTSALPGKVYDTLYGQVHERVVTSVQWTLEPALDEEMRDYLGGERSERGLLPRRPEATRSGTSKRELWTQDGGIFDLCVPTRRRGNRDLTWQSIERDERCGGPLRDQQLWHSALGHRRRDWQAAMHLTLGAVLDLAACHRLVVGLAERAQALKPARLETPPPIVLGDGLWRTVAGPTGDSKRDAVGRKRPGKHQAKRVMLTALGIWADGPWEMLTWQLAPGKDAPSWGAFLGTLYGTGITEETTQRIVSDGAQGLEKALYSPLWGVPHQRAILHKIKNIADPLQETELRAETHETSFAPRRQATQAYKQAILAEAGQREDPDVEGEVRARAQAFEDKWKGREPKAVEVLMHGFAQTLSSLSVDFPRTHVSLIRTTHLRERFHKDIRRKQRDIGMVQSETGCEVFWYMVALRETAQQRAGCRRAK